MSKAAWERIQDIRRMWGYGATDACRGHLRSHAAVWDQPYTERSYELTPQTVELREWVKLDPRPGTKKPEVRPGRTYCFQRFLARRKNARGVGRVASLGRYSAFGRTTDEALANLLAMVVA